MSNAGLENWKSDQTFTARFVDDSTASSAVMLIESRGLTFHRAEFDLGFCDYSVQNGKLIVTLRDQNAAT